jgi:DNA-binding beta-propeller fold protein YncE
VAFDVFISYSSNDKPIADATCAALESANIRCWIAPRDISPGRDYGESIIDAIEGAKIFVLILSGSANASPQISREVERAVSKGLVIVPVRIEDVVPSRNLEYFISSPHWLDAFPPPRDKYFAKLILSVQALLGTATSGAPKASTTAPATLANMPSVRRRSVSAAAAAALIVVVAGAYALYRIESQPLVRTLTGHGADADSVAFTPDGKLIAAGGWDASIQFWNVANGQLQSPGISGFQGHAAPFSPDGKMIAGGAQTGNNVVLWDVATHRVLQTLSGHADKVQSVAFSPDGKLLASGGNDHVVFLWDLGGAQPGRKLVGHSDEVISVAVSSGGKWIASASFDQTVTVWDVASGQPVQTIRGASIMDAAVFSADDGLLATAGGDSNVTLWDTRTWQPVGIIPGNGQPVMTIAFSPTDGRLIASGSYDNEVRVWNTMTTALVRTFSGHTGAVWAVGFSPDGKSLASASADKTVKIWKMP